MSRPNPILNIFLAVLISAILVACGESDPRSKYKGEFENTVKPHEVKSSTQYYSAADMYSLSVPVVTTAAGGTVKAQIQFRSFMNDFVPELVIASQPGNGSLSARVSKDGAYSWTYTWSVPANFLPKDKVINDAIQVVLEVKAGAGSSVAVANMIAGLDPVSRQEPMNIVVVSSVLAAKTELPRIEKIVGIKSKITEGELLPITLDVLDNSSKVDNTPPEMIVSFNPAEVTKEQNFASGVAYVLPNLKQRDAERLGSGKWRFHYFFDTKFVPVAPARNADGSIDAKATSLFTKVTFRARSVDGEISVPIHSVVEIVYKNQVVEGGAK